MTYTPPKLKRDLAREFLLAYFADKPEGDWRHNVMAAAPENISRRLWDAAATAVGIERTPGGQRGAIWRLPQENGERG